MIHLSTSEVRKDLAGTVKRVRGGDRVALVRHGEVVAAIVSAEDLTLLELNEDRIDRREAEKAEERAQQEGTISWDDLKAESGL